MKRKVIITNNCNLQDPTALAANPLIKKYWHLPHEYAMFEISHPAFQLTRDARFGTGIWDETTRRFAEEAVQEERNILQPLFESLEDPAHALMLAIPTSTTIYEFLGREKERMQWPDIGCSPRWEMLSQIRVAGRIIPRGGEKAAGDLKDLFDRWRHSLKSEGLEISCSELAVVGTYFQMSVTCKQGCGDAMLALYTLLAVSSSHKAIQGVGFFDEDDFESLFLEIGGSRKTEQVRLF